MMNNKDTKMEQIVLGSLIVEPSLFATYKSKLSINLFTEQSHKVIFEMIENLWQNEQPIDAFILIREFNKKGINALDKYILDLITVVTSSANIEYYIMILVELYIKRDFIYKFSTLTSLAKDSQDIFEIRDKAFEYFDDLFINKFIEVNKQNEKFADLIEKVENKFRSITNGNNTGITGLESSLSVINKTFGGWQNSDLTIIAGRPGMGKTAFMIQQIVDVAQVGMPVGVFSLEMSAEQITSRVLTNITEIKNSSVLRKGLNDEELQIYWQKKDDLVSLPIHIDDTPSISIQNIRTKAKMLKLKYDIKILFVDYLQLITYEKANTREQEISKISRGLKSLAKELDIPIIALSQLSREVEKRPNKRPFLSDLRDSGSIEQDADEVIFLYRPEYYGIEEWDDFYNNEPTANEIEIIIAKNRHGGIQPERCKVNMATSSFYNH
ncbi:replicative DNA helicase [Riemerella anatipestifer]|uniref:replicative DNA helicase n=1 Tax=Riemerella anatipestifer TaxID=34085 RepID=UPI002A9048D8|nr:replicative DNA helicase [Riemerella anatipestifer]MDY3325775.1 replicative DNA helicase [Riemerella anatipestifer]MDY3354317.1 replicative DNA helicase [Riemerella anatipestifer]MEE3725576.1 replicative DNA helicase [Riemerella anatipestifer]